MRARVVIPAIVTAGLLPVGWQLSVRLDNLVDSGPAAAVLTGIVAALTVSALVGEHRRPGRRIAPLLSALAMVVLLSAFRSLPSPWWSAVGALAWLAGPLVIADVLMSYPDGLGAVEHRRVALTCWLIPAVLAGAIISVSGPRHDGEPSMRALSWSEGRFPYVRLRNPLAAIESDSLVRVLTAVWVAWILMILARTAMVLGRRWSMADASDRLLRRPIALAGVVALLGVAVQMLATLPTRDPRMAGSLFDLDDWYGTMLRAAPVITLPVLAGLFVWLEVLRPQLARAASGALIMANDESIDTLEGRLRRALDDPSLIVGFRHEHAWVDSGGRLIEPGESPDRARTVLMRDGRELAVLEHDASVAVRSDDIELAARLTAVTLDNERLRSVTLAHADDVRSSGERLLHAADRARRNLEHDLTVGPIALLSAAENELTKEASAGELARSTEFTLEALGALRRLSHGLAPPTLDQFGLGAAIDDLSGRSDNLGRIEVVDGRFPRPIETTLYVAVTHALDNAAGPVDVATAVTPDEIRLELCGSLAVVDDIVSERVAALGGTVTQADGAQVIVIPLLDARSSLAPGGAVG